MFLFPMYACCWFCSHVSVVLPLIWEVCSICYRRLKLSNTRLDWKRKTFQITMWYVIVTCRTLSWTLTSLLSSMIMLSALLSPQWLLGKGENSIGVYTRCMEKQRTNMLQCTTLATRGLATDAEVFPTEWKIATVFISIGR